MTRATDEQLVLVRAYADSIRMRDTAAALKAVLAELSDLRTEVWSLNNTLKQREEFIHEMGELARWKERTSQKQE